MFAIGLLNGSRPRAVAPRRPTPMTARRSPAKRQGARDPSVARCTGGRRGRVLDGSTIAARVVTNLAFPNATTRSLAAGTGQLLSRRDGHRPEHGGREPEHHAGRGRRGQRSPPSAA
ncbi:MAG: hypothetical protein MZW92_39825 [Comamonadaceae bacterium]|nr:hypothetical protein [Comamonadaceae bacterium]